MATNVMTGPAASSFTEPSHFSSRNSSHTKLLVICELGPENGMDNVFDLTTLRDDDERISYCLMHEQYLCQLSHSRSSSLAVEHSNSKATVNLGTDENAIAISPAEEPDSSEETDAEQGIAIPTARPGGRVRFRSRVRIASGLHRQHKSSNRDSVDYTNCNELTVGESSLSSSPSSSISAPLRSEATNDAECRPEWGTLGQRVRLFAYRGKGKASMSPEGHLEKRERRRRKLGLPPLDPSSYTNEMRSVLPSERTPLVGNNHARSSLENEGVQTADPFYDSDDEEDGPSTSARLSREVDRMFGTFPGRLLNRHWWWWQLEPLATCNCSIHDSEYD